MIRQSITLTEPNDDWLKQQSGKGREYLSKSDAVNDLIRKARAKEKENEAIRARLIAAEQSGFIEPDRDGILAGFKKNTQRADG